MPRSLIARARSWYGRFERPLSSASLVGGFVFDAVTLTRVDQFWENIWVIAHIAIVIVCIIWINAIENAGHDEANPDKLHFWLVNILQFFFGGIFSVFLVFYFRSADLMTTWPFLLILAIAFVANESLKRRYTRLAFQISLLFLSLFSFAIYIVPIIFHEINGRIFLVSGAASLAALWIILAILRTVSREKFKKSGGLLALSVAAIYFGMNLLYFYNLIPPLPLSLKDSGIFHALAVNGPGDYTVSYEDQGPWRFLALRDTVAITPGEPLYAYSAVFSPTALNTDIIHEWQFYDPSLRAWTTRSRVTLSVIGGRDGGYRTFSMSANIAPGLWRVNVLTPNGQIIGRMPFFVIATSSLPQLLTKTID